MSTKRPRFYLDSCVFIDFLQKTPNRIKECSAIFDAAKAQTIDIVTSTVAIAEVVKVPDGEDAQLIEEFFDNDFIVLRQVDRRTGLEARRLGAANSGIKPMDAIHLVTAIAIGATTFYTYDEKLLSKNGKIGPAWFKIVKPPIPQQDLFDDP